MIHFDLLIKGDIISDDVNNAIRKVIFRKPQKEKEIKQVMKIL